MSWNDQETKSWTLGQKMVCLGDCECKNIRLEVYLTKFLQVE